MFGLEWTKGTRWWRSWPVGPFRQEAAVAGHRRNSGRTSSDPKYCLSFGWVTCRETGKKQDTGIEGRGKGAHIEGRQSDLVLPTWRIKPARRTQFMGGPISVASHRPPQLRRSCKVTAMILPKLLMRCWGTLRGCIMCKKDNHEASRRFTAKNVNRVRLLAVPFLLRSIYPVQDYDAGMRAAQWAYESPLSVAPHQVNWGITSWMKWWQNCFEFRRCNGTRTTLPLEGASHCWR